MKKIILTIIILAVIVALNFDKVKAEFTSGLVLLYSMDTRSVVNGVSKNQVSPVNNGRHIAIASSSFYVNGKISQGFDFDGTNDAIQTASPPIAHGPAVSYSFAFWMSKDADVANQSNMFAGNGGTTNAFITAFLHNVTGTMFFRVCKENVDCRDTPVSAVLPIKKWIHVAGVYDGASTIMTLYINGASTTSRVQNMTGITTGTTNGMFIGSYKTPSLFFNGKMDDARVYNTVLTSQQVYQLYRYGLSKRMK